MINLSIIIPHFNSVSSLDKLLYSIPNLQDIQTIVIDDKSDEEYSKELLKLKIKYAKSNIDFYCNDSNKKGAGTCRNIGLKQAIGKWVLFADSDDYFLDGFYDIIKKYFNTDNELVFFKSTSVEMGSGELSNRHTSYNKLIDNFIKNKEFKSEASLRYFFYVPWSKLIKRSLINDKNIYFDEIIASNDLMFSTKIGHYVERFDVSEEILYCVTRSEGTLTTTINEVIFESRLNAFVDYYQFIERKLSRKEFNILGLSGRPILINSIGLGFRKTLFTYMTLKRNQVNIMSIKFFNPIWLIKRVLQFYKKLKGNKEYYER